MLAESQPKGGSMLKALREILIMAVIIGFFVGAVIFVASILVAAIFSAGIIASVGDALLLFVACWLIGSVLTGIAMLTNSFGFGR